MIWTLVDSSLSLFIELFMEDPRNNLQKQCTKSLVLWYENITWLYNDDEDVQEPIGYSRISGFLKG